MKTFIEYLNEVAPLDESGYGLNKAGGAGFTPGKAVSKVVNPSRPFSFANIASPAQASGTRQTFNKMKRRPSQII